MRIKWYGTASLLIEGGGTRILIDPYLRKLNKNLPPFPVEEAAQADAVFITHPHLDHFSDIGEFIAAGVKQIYVSESGIQIAQENGIPDGRMMPLSANERVTVGGLTVQTFRSRHCKFDAATVLGIALNPVTYLHFKDGVFLLQMMKKYKIEADDICALEISCEGKKVMVLGSAGMDENTQYPEGADLLVFPYQGRARMHRELVPFLQTFRPGAVMIDHHDNAFPPFTHSVNTKKFAPTVEKMLPGTKAIVPQEEVWYQI